MAKKERVSFSEMLSCEIYKIIHNKWMILALSMLPIIVILAFVYLGFNDYSRETQSGIIDYPKNPWTTTIYYLFKLTQYTLPFIIVIISAQYFLIEKQSDGLKMFLTAPYNKKKLFITKYISLLIVFAISVLLAYLLFLIGIKFFEILYPRTSFEQYDMRIPLAVFFSKVLFLTFCIAIIQYGLSIITNNYMIPLVVAITLIMPIFDIGDLLFVYSPGGYIYLIQSNFYLYETHYYLDHGVIMIIIPLAVFAISIVHHLLSTKN